MTRAQLKQCLIGKPYTLGENNKLILNMLLKHPLPVIQTGSFSPFIKKRMSKTVSPSIHSVELGGWVAHVFGFPWPENHMKPQPLLNSFTTSLTPLKLPSDVHNFTGIKSFIMSRPSCVYTSPS